MIKLRYYKVLIIAIFMVSIVVCIPLTVFAAGAMDSNPNTELSNGSTGELHPGQENQQNQQKKEEEKKKEEIKAQTKWTDGKKKNMSAQEIVDYIKENYAIKDGVSKGEIGSIDESQEVKEAWVETLEKDGKNVSGSETILKQLTEKTYGVTTIYTSQPKKKNDEGNSGESLDDAIDDADKFINEGEIKYNQSKLSEVSNTIYNILLSVGIMIAVIMGAILGIKLMISGIDQKVEAKKLLVPYVIGCVVVFGGFGIWKLIVTILQGV